MSYYNSTTHGKIPLSVTGKHLLQRLRFAIVHAIGTGDYNADRQAIAHARGELARYISRLENPISYFGEPPMCTKAPETDAAAMPPMAAMAAMIADVASVAAGVRAAYKSLIDKTTATATSHGRDAVIAILSKYGVSRVSLLTVTHAANYERDLDALANTSTPEQLLKQREDAAIEVTRSRPYESFDAKHRALFEAGRAFQREVLREAQEKFRERQGVDMGVRSNY